MAQYALGFDYGTNSVRALLVDISDGREVATAVFEYPSGNLGVIEDPRDPNLARQNPQDYVDGLIATAKQILTDSGVGPAEIVGIGVDTTGSSPMPVDVEGTPLAMRSEWKDNPAAHCWLWKDHTSFAEAEEITQKAEGLPYLAKCGGKYSSEWFWSKILHCARTAPDVFDAAYSWVEIADFVPGWLTGTSAPGQLSRSVCAAGHKAMFADEWGGLPSREFLATLDPRLAELRPRLYATALPSDQWAGRVTAQVASLTGLAEGTPVAVGAFDAHFGAVASGVRPGTLVKIIGTSTCDCMVHPLDQPLADVPGLCGIVRGSVLPDHYGLEAGQSAVGDIFNWFATFVGQSQEVLTEAANRLLPGASGLLALDWSNGNRTVLVDPRLTGLLLGQTLHTTPAEVYRALIEATAFGALKIIRRLQEYGVAVDEVVNCGGIAEKSPLVMQIYADVCNMPMKVSRSAQTCALGSAIFGSVVGGAHPSVAAAQKAMTGVKDRIYVPSPEAVAVYADLFTLYTKLHDAFGAVRQENLGAVMKDLLEIRDRARS